MFNPLITITALTTFWSLPHLAFNDELLPGGESVMEDARHLVGHFMKSTQAMDNLLQDQNRSKPLKVIQDVTTRWWSTLSMIDRLITLQELYSSD